MLILRHQMRQKNRGALFSVTVRPGEGQMGAISLKSPNLPRGFQGVSPWSSRYYEKSENNAEIYIFCQIYSNLMHHPPPKNMDPTTFFGLF